MEHHCTTIIEYRSLSGASHFTYYLLPEPLVYMHLFAYHATDLSNPDESTRLPTPMPDGDEDVPERSKLELKWLRKLLLTLNNVSQHTYNVALVLLFVCILQQVGICWWCRHRS